MNLLDFEIENKPPVIAPIGIVDIEVGVEVTIRIICNDPENSMLTFSKTEGSPGELVDNVFTWTPSSCDPVQIG